MYYLKSNAEIESFECNIWGFSFLQDMLSLLGADPEDFSISNDAEEVSGENIKKWGNLISSRKDELAIGEVLLLPRKTKTLVPIHSRWGEEAVKDYISKRIAKGDDFLLEKIRQLSKEEVEFIDRFSGFLLKCDSYTQ